MINILAPIIMAIGNRLRGSDSIFVQSTTVKRLIYFAIPFAMLLSIQLDSGLLYFPFLLFAWLCWSAYGRPREMSNAFSMSLYGLGRGIILSTPLLFMMQYHEAGFLILAFTMQGPCYYIGKLISIKQGDMPKWLYKGLNEFTEWGEVFTGFLIGVAITLIGIF